MQNCKAKKSKDSCEKENEEKCQISHQNPQESAPATRARILLQPVKQKMVKNVVLMQPMKDCTRADIYATTYRGPHTRIDFVSGYASRGVSTLELSEELYFFSGSVLEELQPVGKIHVDIVHEMFHLMEKTHITVAEKCKKERVSGKSCYGLNIIPIPYPSALLRKGKEVKKSGIKFSLGRIRQVFFCGVFLFFFFLLCFSLSYHYMRFSESNASSTQRLLQK